MKNLSFILIIFTLFSCQQNSVTVKSPDGKIELRFWIDEVEDNFYSVNYENENIIQPSFLGFQTEGEPNIGLNMKIISVTETEVNTSWEPVYGERSYVNDHYNQVIIHLKETVSPGREFQITFKVYNEGVAFQTTFLPFDGANSMTIKQELTEFNFNGNFESWISDRAQSEYRKQKINSIDKPAERPLVIEAGENFVALGEAKLVDFARMKFLS